MNSTTSPRSSLTHRRVAFVVNGSPTSAMGERATAFAARLPVRFDSVFVYRDGGKGRAAGRMLRRLAAGRPDVCYVLDLAADGVAAATAYRCATGTRFVLDTGDDIVALGRALGRGPAAQLATRSLDAFALRAAAVVVVRGEGHRDALARRGVPAVFIPDGVDVNQFAPAVEQIPPPPGPDRPLVIGLVGSSVWVPARQTCYGAELVELVRLLRGRLPVPVRGVLIGDGTGVPVLQQRCAADGLSADVTFSGRVPYPNLPSHLHGFHIALSTQTDDAVGRVRTTGKLPLYLAAGRYILASAVGQATRVLPPDMLVPYVGESDPTYSTKLADRVADLVARRTDFAYRPECVTLARTHFEYDLLADRVSAVLDRVLGQ